MKGDLWLAVGDETGKWDEYNKTSNFLGVALVIAKVSKWQSALSEKINGKSVEQRMLHPLYNLPASAQKSHYHHVRDALLYWQNSQTSLHGEWTLKKPAQNPLQQELFANLRWLAEHRDLITLCGYSQGEFVWKILHRDAKDPALALSQVYALLASLVLPFLKKQDRLLILPASRREKPQIEARARAEHDSDNTRVTLTYLYQEINRILDTWQIQKPRFDVGTFNHLQNKYFKNNYVKEQPFLKNQDKAMVNIADMGAALTTLTKNPKGNIRLAYPQNTWQNVKFFDLETLKP